MSPLPFLSNIKPSQSIVQRTTAEMYRVRKLPDRLYMSIGLPKSVNPMPLCIAFQMKLKLGKAGGSILSEL